MTLSMVGEELHGNQWKLGLLETVMPHKKMLIRCRQRWMRIVD